MWKVCDKRKSQLQEIPCGFFTEKFYCHEAFVPLSPGSKEKQGVQELSFSWVAH